MSVVKINAIEVPAERADVMAQRFAARAGDVGKSEGFEEFQLLRPSDERTTWLVYTRWRDEEAFEAWRSSQAFGGAHGASGAQGHGGPPSQGGPVATGSELWSFLVEQREQAP
jgi:heme-degrading monooxygenase HmoA